MREDMVNKKRAQELTIFKAEIAAKYGAPVYSRHPPITAIFPDLKHKLRKHYNFLFSNQL